MKGALVVVKGQSHSSLIFTIDQTLHKIRVMTIERRINFVFGLIKSNELQPSSLHDDIKPLTITNDKLPSTLSVKLLYELSTSNNLDHVHVLITTC